MSLLAHIGPVPPSARSKPRLHLVVQHLILKPYMGIDCKASHDFMVFVHAFLPLLQNLKSMGLYLTSFERATIQTMSEYGSIAPHSLRSITVVVSLQVPP
jgi:hypothetical protein